MRTIEVILDGVRYEVEVRPDPTDRTRYTVLVDGEPLPVYVPIQSGPGRLEWMVIDNRPYELVVGKQMEWLSSSAGQHTLEVRWKGAAALEHLGRRDGRVIAPIPGLIRRVLVQVGQKVEGGAPLLVLEAMKMENEIRAPHSGVVRAIDVQAGQSVALGEVMAEIG